MIYELDDVFLLTSGFWVCFLICKSNKKFICNVFCFFLSGFLSQTLPINGTAGEGKGSLYYSLPLPSTHEHSGIHLQLCLWDIWLSRIFNRIACKYQTATPWDFPHSSRPLGSFGTGITIDINGITTNITIGNPKFKLPLELKAS